MDTFDREVKCEHGKPCFLKTGLKQSSSYLKSFYICSQYKEKCNFFKEDVEIKAMKCPEHKENYVGLRALRINESKQQCRIYYSCSAHDADKVWCGHIQVANISSSHPSISHAKNHSYKSVQDAFDTKKLGEMCRETNVYSGNGDNKSDSQKHDKCDNYSPSNDTRFSNNCQFLTDNEEISPKINTIKSKEVQKKNSPISTIINSEILNNEYKEKECSSVDESILRLQKQLGSLNLGGNVTIQKLEDKLNKTKDLVRTINIKLLPDKGQKLKNDMEVISEVVEKMKLNTFITTDAPGTSSLDSLPLNNFVQYTSGPAIKNDIDEKPTGYSETLFGSKMIANKMKHVAGITSDAIDKLHSQLQSCPSSSCELFDPNGLKIDLLAHQRRALAWLKWRESQEPKGGILADDMGLGKTLTMISLILMQKQNNVCEQKQLSEWMNKSKYSIPSACTLIICPASLIHQWRGEIERRVTSNMLSIHLYHGTSRKISIDKLATMDIVLTTYNIVSSEVGITPQMKNEKHSHNIPCVDEETEGCLNNGSSLLLRVQWHRIILDEGHSIKNHKSLTAMSICRLRAEIRWVLTGTPIHNDLLDVYSLLRFLRCAPFDEYKLWKREVDNKSEYGQNRLNTLIKALMLRRTKDESCMKTGKQLVSLPTKRNESYELTLSEEERRFYDKIFNKSRATIQEYFKEQDLKEFGSSDLLFRKALPETSFPGKEVDLKRVGKQSSGSQILLMLLRLRQSCCHLHLMKQSVDAEDLRKDNLEVDLISQLNFSSLKDLEDIGSSFASSFDIETPSTKINFLISKMCSVRDQSLGGVIKSVIVSQWTKMLKIVEHHLKKSGFRCCTIKGDIPAHTRSEIVDAFNSDCNGPEVLLLSLRAGGVGLNLIGGNHLYLIDMHWNPALEQQACDRIYRVGQKKEVFIHKIICQNTIEEKIVLLQEMKMKLAKSVLSGGSQMTSKLSLTDLRTLFGIEAKC